MKRVTPIILTAFSALALSFSVTTFADNNTDSEGFKVFEAQVVETPSAAISDAVQAPAATASSEAVEAAPKKPKVKKKAKKQAKKKVQKRTKRTKRAMRKKRSTRATRAQRSKSLKRAKTYRVRRGDTLFRISVKSGVGLKRLVRLNKLYGKKKNNIQAGQRLRLR